MEDSLSQGVRSVPGAQPDEAVVPTPDLLGAAPEPAMAATQPIAPPLVTPLPGGPPPIAPQLVTRPPAAPPAIAPPIASPPVAPSPVAPPPVAPSPVAPSPVGSQLVAPQSAGPQLVDRSFGRDEITDVRHEVSDRLAAAGLAGDRLQGFVLAVNEVVTNVVLHAGGQGRITLGLAGGSARCSVTDSGPGIPAHYLSTCEAPGALEVGGRGIWLAYQLCDEVTVATGPFGTTVGLRIALAPGTA